MRSLSEPPRTDAPIGRHDDGGTRGTAFISLADLQAGALLVGSDPFFNSRREQLVGLASRYGVPAMYEWREFAAAGGLISYGPSLTAAMRQLGIYAGKILGGAKAADLPVRSRRGSSWS
jgi:putative ABC transport system substrate-binding protein